MRGWVVCGVVLLALTLEARADPPPGFEWIIKTPIQGLLPREHPPSTSPATNGGRTHAIAVHPVEPQRMVIATSFGGLWSTINDGAKWAPIDSLPGYFFGDVEWSPDGKTLI